MDYETLRAELPDGVEPGYDGMEIAHLNAGGDQALTFIYLIGCLVLVVSALLVRRIPIGQGLKMFAGWVLIFVAAFVAFTLKDDFIALGKRVVAEAKGEGEIVRVGKEMRIRKSLDGHFWVNARLNGAKVHFLIDSGATVTSISADTARRAHIDSDDGFPGAGPDGERHGHGAARAAPNGWSSARSSGATWPSRFRLRSATLTCSA